MQQSSKAHGPVLPVTTVHHKPEEGRRPGPVPSLREGGCALLHRPPTAPAAQWQRLWCGPWAPCVEGGVCPRGWGVAGASECGGTGPGRPSHHGWCDTLMQEALSLAMQRVDRACYGIVLEVGGYLVKNGGFSVRNGGFHGKKNGFFLVRVLVGGFAGRPKV